MNWENTIKKERISSERYFRNIESFEFNMGRLSEQVMNLEDDIKQGADEATLLKKIDYIKKAISRNMEMGVAYIKEARQNQKKGVEIK